MLGLYAKAHNLSVTGSLYVYLSRMKQHQLYNENKGLIFLTCLARETYSRADASHLILGKSMRDNKKKKV